MLTPREPRAGRISPRELDGRPWRHFEEEPRTARESGWARRRCTTGSFHLLGCCDA